MLLGACAGPAARAPARSAGQLAGSPTISPSTINSRARRLPEPGSAQHHRHRHAGAAVCAPPAALPSESLPETRKDQEQRLAALEVQARQCELLLDQAEAAAAAAAAPKAAKAAADEALQPWVYAAAGAGSKAAKQLKGLRTEADEIVESLSKALCGECQGWERGVAGWWVVCLPGSPAYPTSKHSTSNLSILHSIPHFPAPPQATPLWRTAP